MLKDHVDYPKLIADLKAYTDGTGPKPADVATWRRAREGEVCGGCGRPLVAGQPVMEAFADGSVGHAACHTGERLVVTGGNSPRRQRRMPTARK